MHFIMEHEQMSYPEALKYLAKKYGIEIKERELSSEEKIAQGERESLFIVNNFARDYFQNILKNHVDGRSIGMAYFRSRGFRDDIIEKFQLGYCTESHDALAQEALKKGYKKDYLVKTGLCYETDDHRLRDRFWGRVIFPVHTLSGKVVAFGGRVLAGATKGVKVKYVNSPESEIYIFCQTSHCETRPLFSGRRLYRRHFHAPIGHRECGCLFGHSIDIRTNPDDSSFHQQYDSALRR